MKLPVYVKKDGPGLMLCDARKRVFVVMNDTPENNKALTGVAKRLNSDWRYRWCGLQPYLYDRNDWLCERATS